MELLKIIATPQNAMVEEQPMTEVQDETGNADLEVGEVEQIELQYEAAEKSDRLKNQLQVRESHSLIVAPNLKIREGRCYTVEPLNSGNHWFSKKVPATKR